MKRMALISIVVLAFLVSCADDILFPSGDVAHVEIANVIITFDFEAQIISVHNGNASRCEIQISRWNKDAQKYTDILRKTGVDGYSEICRESEFEHGDEIRIWLKIEGEEISRYYIFGAPFVDGNEELIEVEPDWEIIIR